MESMDPIARWSEIAEGQFFERKSAFDRSGLTPKRRPAAEIAKDIVETLSAMANADGGELVIGIEDDGAATGVPHPEERITLLMRAAGERNYVTPPLRYEAELARASDGRLLLHFIADWGPDVHQLSDGRYLLRVGDRNMPFAAERIAALKSTKAQGLVERTFPPGAEISDIDLELVARVLGRTTMTLSPEEFLRRFRLVEVRNGTLVPCLAGLLLFGRDAARWHPRCGVDFVRWEGSERRFGTELNVIEWIRVEYPLAILIERAYDTIRPFIRSRQRLQDLFFTENLEYPTFVWQEALVNAVAHRDYGILGMSIDVWMFDDRMEIRSPGLPPHPVTVEALNRQEHVHLSRNPLIVRVLAELGYMRELGEGVPRMFREMEREGFYPPYFSSAGGYTFQVTLRNQPVYDRDTLQWLELYRAIDLSGDQKRLLAHARTQGNAFTSRDYQKLTGLDIYGASNSIKDLIRKRIVRSTGKRSRVYQIIEQPVVSPDLPPDIARLMPVLRQKGDISNEDIRGVLGVSRPTATRLARELLRTGWLVRSGAGRWTRYRAADPTMRHSAVPSMRHSANATVRDEGDA